MLSVFLCTAFAFASAATAFSANGVKTATAQTALPHAATQVFASRTVDETDEAKDKLILPQTYEEYLPLTAPTAVAVNASYTAIAQDNALFVYNREENEYTKYEHEVGGMKQKIQQLQFCEDGKLYFSADASGENFYRLDLTTLQKTKINEIACHTFVIYGKELYFANSAGTLYAADLESESSPVPLLPEHETNPNKPTLAFWNGELYFTDNGVQQILYKIKPSVGIPTPVATLPRRLERMTIETGVFAYTTSGGDFYACPLSQISDENAYSEVAQDGFAALSSFDGMIYAVQPQKGAIKQYSTAEKAFTAFEICASSAAQNRLSGATAACLFKDELFLADEGNERISIYNTKTQTFETFESALARTSLLSSDGKTLLAVNGTKAVLYSLTGENRGGVVASFERFKNTVKGIASVYGTHYLVTDGYAYQISKNPETQAFELIERKKGCTSFVSPTLLSADVYGNLFVATGNFLYRFSETDFMQPEKEGEEVMSSLPANATQIAFDYEGNLYALENGNLYKNGETEPLMDFAATSYVYGIEGYTPNVTALAVSVEKNAVYALCDGNYVVEIGSLHLPSVNTISVNGADEQVFSMESAVFSVVEIRERALTVAFDLTALNGATYFPYLSMERQTESVRALKIGECGDYNLLAVFDEHIRQYRSFLVLKAFCEELSASEYKTDYAQDEQKIGYLTNQIPLYKFPYLTRLLTADALSRGCKVTLLGEINELDHAYYHVQYETENGETKQGYVPKAYINLFDGSPKETETFIAGETESNLDAVWRLGYLLLGFAAICILTDYLILRQDKDEE